MFDCRSSGYRQVDSSEESFSEKGEGHAPAQWARKHNTCSSLRYICFFSILINVILVGKLAYQAHGGEQAIPGGVSRFAGLTYNTPMRWSHLNPYLSENQTERDETWEAIDTDPVSVTLSAEEVAMWDLPASSPHPWDETRSLYFLNAYHLLHCMKLLYRSHRHMDIHGKLVPDDHIYHCLDNIRQFIECHADDTPMTKPVEGQYFGDNQLVQCRNIDSLKQWAREPVRNPCYRMVNDYAGVSNSIEKYAYCPPDSPYEETMKAYFEAYGHSALFADAEVENDPRYRLPHTTKYKNKDGAEYW